MEQRNIINTYYVRISNSKNRNEETKKVINEIAQLKYHGGQPISISDRNQILKGIIKLGEKRKYSFYDSSNTEYLKLLTLALENNK